MYVLFTIKLVSVCRKWKNVGVNVIRCVFQIYYINKLLLSDDFSVFIISSYGSSFSTRLGYSPECIKDVRIARSFLPIYDILNVLSHLPINLYWNLEI